MGNPSVLSNFQTRISCGNFFIDTQGLFPYAPAPKKRVLIISFFDSIEVIGLSFLVPDHPGWIFDIKNLIIGVSNFVLRFRIYVCERLSSLP